MAKWELRLGEEGLHQQGRIHREAFAPREDRASEARVGATGNRGRRRDERVATTPREPCGAERQGRDVGASDTGMVRAKVWPRRPWTMQARPVGALGVAAGKRMAEAKRCAGRPAAQTWPSGGASGPTWMSEPPHHGRAEVFTQRTSGSLPIASVSAIGVRVAHGGLHPRRIRIGPRCASARCHGG